jgi:hypothetical protein
VRHLPEGLRTTWPLIKTNLRGGELEMKTIVTKLGGVTDRRVQDHIRTFGNKDFGGYTLIREPENPHDPNAIKVTVAGVVFLGYLPREIAAELAPLIDVGAQFDVFFVSLNQHPIYRTVGLTVRIKESHPKKPCEVAGE